ncbi:MAG: hypothetical protein JRL30_10005 [Deltaproteobacteria bacterium]|nr:hypothetical protein [Deltaproteobacteria bacterium]
MRSIWKKRYVRLFLFPASVSVIYCIVFIWMPEKAVSAIRNSGKVFLLILMPLSFVFILMTALNIFLKPAHIVTFFGRNRGIKGIALSVAAGIVSMGPIYAWYPMLKALREKGLSDFLVAIFLGNRAVKPFLLPIMISIFGWIYVLILMVFIVFGSIGVGYCVDLLGKEDITREESGLGG